MADGDQPATDDRLLRRGPLWAVLAMGLPLAIGIASHGLINLVDLALVGQLGPDAILAAHVASTWNFLPMLLGQCVSTALLARLAQRLGRGDVDGARRLHLAAERQMLWLALWVGLATALPAAWQVDACGLVGAARADAIHYLVVANLGCLPMFVLMQTTAAMRACGEAALPLLLLLLANGLNLLLDVLLLFGWPAVGLPSCGPVGAAYATVAARAVAAFVAWRWLLRRQHRLSLRAVPAGPAERLGGALLVDAWPLVAQIGLRALPVLGLTALLQRLGSGAEAVAFGIATRWDTVLLFGSLGFANAATAYVARAVAAGQRRNAVLAGWVAALAAMGFSASILLACQAAAAPIAGWFAAVPDPEVAAAFAAYLATAGWSQVLGAGALAAVGALHGAGRLRLPLVADLLGFVWLGACWWWLAVDATVLEPTYRALVVGAAGLLVVHMLVVSGGWWVSKWRPPHRAVLP